ncbi:hypothetical protein A0256_03405 [Mucilaginibacter sp. PAMC 26640]|nr:hypothetical protein A0256_03405 [Mucilaginibacter sp. PAMC 26640]
MIKGYPSPYYITFKQAAHLKGAIKKGEKGIRIIYWATINSKISGTDSPQPIVDEPSKAHTIMVPKVYTVFNIAQTEGIDFPYIEFEQRSEYEKIEACENVIAEMPNKPTINTNGINAYYRPSTDTVVVPSLKLSKSNEEYYNTLFHELAHSTGHTNRLNRKELMQSDGFGKSDYAKVELIAEMTAAFLSAITGIG